MCQAYLLDSDFIFQQTVKLPEFSLHVFVVLFLQYHFTEVKTKLTTQSGAAVVAHGDI